MSTTNIEWCDRVWNPVTGCTKVSAGCKNCYAEGVAHRFFAKQYPPVSYVTCSDARGCTHEAGTCDPFTEARPREFTDVQTHEDRLFEPLRWRKPARIFVNSMSDLFHEDVPFEFIDRVFAVMSLAKKHTFLILTKRPARMREYLAAPGLSKRTAERMITDHEALLIKRREIFPGNGFVLGGLRVWPLPNVHVGVSVENQQTADERIPLLLQTPAAIRWVSYEPALGPVDFDAPHCENCHRDNEHIVPPQNGANHWCIECDSEACFGWWLGGDPGLDWIVVGGESGPGARPFDIAWARQTVQQCKAAGVPVFVKQLGASLTGEWHPAEGKILTPRRLRDRKGGDPAEWPEDLRERELPEVRA